jgi:hypothetical protein
VSFDFLDGHFSRLGRLGLGVLRFGWSSLDQYLRMLCVAFRCWLVAIAATTPSLASLALPT